MHETDARILRYLGYGALLTAALWLLYRIKDALPIFVLGLLIAYAWDPWLDRLQARGWSRDRAVRFVFLCFFGFILMVAFIVIPLVVDQVQEFGERYHTQYKEQIASLSQDWQERVEKLIPKRLQPLIFEKGDGSTTSKPRIRSVILTRLEELRDTVLPKVLGIAAGFLQGSIGSLLLLLVLPFIVYYFMHEIDPLRQRVVFLIPERYRETVVAMSRDVNRMIGRYVRGQFIVCLCFAAAAVIILGIWSAVFGMRYFLVLGLIAGVLYIVPYVGMVVNFALVAGIGYLTTDYSLACALCAGGSLIALNLVFDNLVVPRVVGKELGLHPLTVIFALLAGGQFGGLLGMVVAIPVAGAIKAVLLHLFPQLAAPVSEDVLQLVPATPRESMSE
ncbi:MAG: AI-2E family transporter [Abditibacteriales bacterium]|nr:AI-2E family transporter [Abditibacteriales bacterium]MDW8366988.1 AI-2E family transporter [Abditibacteriales bacterium]